MPKRYFTTFNRGENYLITGTLEVPDGINADVDPIGIEIKDYDTFEYVKVNFNKGEFTLPKDIIGEPLIDDLTFREFSQLDISKTHHINLAKEFMVQRFGPSDMFDFVDFIIKHNRLLDAGYFVTNKNMEETIAKLSEDVDMELYDNLYGYFEIRDKVMEKQRWYTIYRRFEKKVEKAKNVEEVSNAWKEFIHSIS
jgi:hypothetical protein